MITAYQELLDRAKDLSSEERLRLADTLLAEELGFGMWLNRSDVQDAAEYVDRTQGRVDARAERFFEISGRVFERG